MKLYGAALHVYELVEPEDLARMLGHPVGTTLHRAVLCCAVLYCEVMECTALMSYRILFCVQYHAIAQ